MERKEFARRRKRLMDIMNIGSIAIMPTSRVAMRNNDVHYHFRPDSDFYYMTGFPEPEAVAVLIPDRKQGEFILFCRESDPQQELWHGRRAGLQQAVDYYGADDAFPISDIDEILPSMIENKERVFYNMGSDHEFDHKVQDWVNQVRNKVRTGVTAPEEFISLGHALHELRLFKSRSEIKAMRRAAQIAAKAHKRAMQVTRPGMKEYQVESDILHEFMQHGSRDAAYPSIVGGGKNACILHYTDNNETLNDGELLLIDAGVEHDYYASDITRTFPINGTFSKEQKLLYEIVLKAQEAAIAKVQPGNHWNDPHDAAVRVLTRGLIDVGILKGRLPTLIKQEAYRPFYMHRTGHWLGMDVHDVGDYKVSGDWRMLEPGMVLTIEPGLYIAEHSRGVSKKWWNIGIRIEDDVLVTKDGHDVLSKDAPKTVAEIEAIMANAA